MGQHNIDKHFKEQLKGYSKNIDTNAVWESLNLDKNKKQKRGWFFWLTGFGCALIAFSVFIITQNDNPLESIKNDQVNIGPRIDQRAHLETQNTIENKVAVIRDTETKDLAVSNSKSAKQNISIQNIAKNNNRIQNFQTKNPSKHKINTSQELHIGYTLPLQKPNSDLTNDVRETIIVSSQGNSATASTPTSDRKYIESQQLVSQKIKIVDATRLIRNRIDLLRVPTRNAPDLLYGEIVFNKNTSWDLDIYTGVASINRNVSATTSLAEDLVSRKNETETPLELFNLGAQIKYDLGSIYFKGGLEFQSINERFQYENVTLGDTITVPNQIAEIHVNALNDTTYLPGEVKEIETLNSRWRLHNSHRLLTIPISLGYEKEISNWNLAAEATLMINVHHTFSGRQLNNSNEISEDPSSINNGIKMGFRLSTSLGYDISDKLGIYLRPHIGFYKDSFVKASENYNQKYQFHGLQAGIKYNLMD